jgi:hypothetical protein
MASRHDHDRHTDALGDLALAGLALLGFFPAGGSPDYVPWEIPEV